MADLCDSVFSDLATMQFASIPAASTGSQISAFSFQFHMRERDRGKWVDNHTGWRMGRGEQV